MMKGCDMLRIQIDGELYHVTEIITCGDLPLIETDEGEAFYLAKDSETAGQAARDRWKEMAENDPSEFRAMVGDETLVNWALGQYGGPGSTKTNSLEDWLDLHLDTPEEEFASYDGQEREVNRCGKLTAELGFAPTVAYRHN